MKAVIFDMDGVIIDSEPLHIRLIMQTFDRYHISFDPKNFDQYVGTTTSFLFKKVISEQDPSISFDEMIAHQIKITFATIRDEDIDPIPGIRELLNALKQRNIPTAIASSSSLALIQTVIKKFDLEGYFQYYTSGEDLPRSKPDPAIYLIAAEKLGINPVDCLVIEDAHVGVAAAKAAGMTCIGFQNQNSGNQDLAKADVIVNSITEIDVAQYF